MKKQLRKSRCWPFQHGKDRWHKKLLGNYWRWLAVGLALTTLLAGPIFAQTISPFPSGSSSEVRSQPTTAPEKPTANPTVSRLVPDQWIVAAETVDAASVYLDGRTLFKVSAPPIEGQRPAEARAQEIQQRLNYLTGQMRLTGQMSQPMVTDGSESGSALGPEAGAKVPNVAVSVDEPSNLPVIFVDDQMLLTVTNLDAQLNGSSPYPLALSLAEKLRMAFQRYLQERSPPFLRQQTKVAVSILGVTILLQLLLRRMLIRLKQRQVWLAEAKHQLGEVRPPNLVVETPVSIGFNTLFDQLQARFDNRQKRKLNETAWGLLSLLRSVLWIASALWILYLFPYSRWLTTLLLQWLEVPAQIFLLAGLAYTGIRLSSLAIDKGSLALQEGAQLASGQSQRLSLRFSTFSQVVKGIVGLLIVVVAGTFALAATGVQIAPLLAGAGIVGLGVSLAAQSLIKDLINGFLILFEDHFGIGDVVSIGGLTGSVEYINLRITQLRDSEGRLITIPNSQINIVQNLSMDWAQVDLRITVSPRSDLTQVLELLKAIATDLSQDPEWQRLILEPPDLLGVEALDFSGVTLRLLLKTQPLQQWPVARELRRRIRDTFAKEGIDMGISQELVSVSWEDAEEMQDKKPKSPDGRA
jgi:moderate conductance mechanosensitive channel